jgi:hypothetical protein
MSEVEMTFEKVSTSLNHHSLYSFYQFHPEKGGVHTITRGFLAFLKKSLNLYAEIMIYADAFHHFLTFKKWRPDPTKKTGRSEKPKE